jgi:hypothetical protein
VQEVDRLGRNLLEGLIVLSDLIQARRRRQGAGGHRARRASERSLILALAEDRRRDIVRKTKDGLEAARRESIRTIAAGVKVSIGVLHKTLTDARQEQQP